MPLLTPPVPPRWTARTLRPQPIIGTYPGCSPTRSIQARIAEYGSRSNLPSGASGGGNDAVFFWGYTVPAGSIVEIDDSADSTASSVEATILGYLADA